MKLGDRSEWEEKCRENNHQCMGIKEEECPFCNLESEEHIIWKGTHFFIVHNKYPLLGLKKHLMAIPYKHYFSTDEMSDEEFLGYKEVELFMKTFYKGENYFSFIRQTVGGRSLAHIHYHYLPGIMQYEHLQNMLKEQGF